MDRELNNDKTNNDNVYNKAVKINNAMNEAKKAFDNYFKEMDNLSKKFEESNWKHAYLDKYKNLLAGMQVCLILKVRKDWYYRNQKRYQWNC